jgi:high-affinity iron transporter
MSLLSARPFAATTAGAATGGPPTPLGNVVAQYRVYVAGKLDDLTTNVANLRAAAEDQDRPTAKRRWLDAQLTWQQIGAAYGSFGPAGTAISGLANGLPGGVSDPGFTGLHRIEWGLYNGDSWSTIYKYAARLVADVASLKANFDKLTIVPTDMPIRCHEILEDSLRDHLSLQSDYGSGMAYALTSADVLGTRVVLEELKPLIPTAVLGHSAYDLSNAALNALDAALNATKVQQQWPDYRTLTKHQRQPVNGAIGGALEALYRIPFVLGKLK